MSILTDLVAAWEDRHPVALDTGAHDLYGCVEVLAIAPLRSGGVMMVRRYTGDTGHRMAVAAVRGVEKASRGMWDEAAFHRAWEVEE